jgi:hypothetical protein
MEANITYTYHDTPKLTVYDSRLLRVQIAILPMDECVQDIQSVFDEYLWLLLLPWEASADQKLKIAVQL